MRDLTLLETGYLAGGLCLCLLMPLLLSFQSSLAAANRRSCLRIVGTGQAILALAGVLVLLSAPVAPYAAALGFLGYLGCTYALLRQFRATRAV